MKLIEKTKVFVKKHGKVIAWTAAGIAGIGLTFAVGKSASSAVKNLTSVDWISDLAKETAATEAERIKSLDWKLGSMVGLWDWDGGEITEAIVNDVPISELGNFGQELAAKLGNFTNTECVSMIVNNQLTKSTGDILEVI